MGFRRRRPSGRERSRTADHSPNAADAGGGHVISGNRSAPRRGRHPAEARQAVDSYDGEELSVTDCRVGKQAFGRGQIPIEAEGNRRPYYLVLLVRFFLSAGGIDDFHWEFSHLTENVLQGIRHGGAAPGR